MIRNAERNARILAIHQVIHSAMALFKQMIEKETFNGYLEIVRVTTDAYGISVSERIVHSYSSTSGIIITHQVIDGIFVIQSSPTLSIRPSKNDRV